MEFKQLTITPSIAKGYLESNQNNRRVKDTKVKLYAREMMAGRWKEGTAEFIKISKAGNVLDGQHRLLAIIMANKPAKMHIAMGVDDNVFDVLDTGSLRTSSDSFKVAGIKYDTVLPSIIATYLNINETGRNTGLDVNRRATNTILIDEYYQRPLFWDFVAKVTVTWYENFAKIIPPSVIGGFYAVFTSRNEDKANAFMNQLCTGFDIKNKTISVLRNKLTQDRLSTLKMTPTYKFALIIKAWNFFKKNEEVKLLKFDASKEEYPIIL